MIRIKLLTDERVIVESLTRMGIANKKRRVIYPSCYLLNEDGEYTIAHFKEIYMKYKEDSYNNMTEEDVVRRDSIVRFLWEWGLVEVIDEITDEVEFVYTLPFREKKNWIIQHKVNMRTMVYDR